MVIKSVLIVGSSDFYLTRRRNFYLKLLQVKYDFDDEITFEFSTIDPIYMGQNGTMKHKKHFYSHFGTPEAQQEIMAFQKDGYDIVIFETIPFKVLHQKDIFDYIKATLKPEGYFLYVMGSDIDRIMRKGLNFSNISDPIRTAKIYISSNHQVRDFKVIYGLELQTDGFMKKISSDEIDKFNKDYIWPNLNKINDPVKMTLKEALNCSNDNLFSIIKNSFLSQSYHDMITEVYYYKLSLEQVHNFEEKYNIDAMCK